MESQSRPKTPTNRTATHVATIARPHPDLRRFPPGARRSRVARRAGLHWHGASPCSFCGLPDVRALRMSCLQQRCSRRRPCLRDGIICERRMPHATIVPRVVNRLAASSPAHREMRMRRLAEHLEDLSLARNIVDASTRDDSRTSPGFQSLAACSMTHTQAGDRLHIGVLRTLRPAHFRRPSSYSTLQTASFITSPRWGEI